MNDQNTAEVMTAGSMTLSPSSEAARGNVGLILDAARKLGIDYPRGGAFLSGQVFFEEGQPVEVRLVVLPKEARGSVTDETDVWTTEEIPQIAWTDQRIGYNPDPKNRAHLSAAINFKSKGELGLIFDLRGGVQIIAPSKQEKLPKRARQKTFLEARSLSHAISDAPTGENFQDVDGELALIHAARHKGRKSPLQTRFQPTPELWNWWGIDNPTKKALREALKKLNFETNMTFQVTLACLLLTEHARRTFTLDEIIKLIGRDTDARRSSGARQRLRREVWGNILTLASMPLIGARPGVWREPGAKGEKRAAMPQQALQSRDPLLVITGGRTTDDKEPPKEVSLTAGEWLMPWVESGNREILSDFGDVLKLAHIPRGNTSGAWAACIGLALQQKWREEATKAQKNLVSRGGEEKIEVLKFRSFTRRELLTELFQCDDSPLVILSDLERRRHRAEEYWKSAINHLKKIQLVGYYRELPAPDNGDLNAAWLDQPLDIRPTEENLRDALTIHTAALEAKTRSKRSGRKTPKKKPPEE